MRRAAFALLSMAAAASAAAQQPPDAFVRPDKGHCIACHQLPASAAPESRNDVGPRLEGARMRELGRAALREIIDDASKRNPQTVMPPFGRHRLLDAGEIDRLAEYLHALP
jgi:L-cysteine S-thiosulfotransferase